MVILWEHLKTKRNKIGRLERMLRYVEIDKFNKMTLYTYIYNYTLWQVLDDWPLHATKSVNTTWTLGACWQGTEQRMKHALTGALSGLTVQIGGFFSKVVFKKYPIDSFVMALLCRSMGGVFYYHILLLLLFNNIIIILYILLLLFTLSN